MSWVLLEWPYSIVLFVSHFRTSLKMWFFLWCVTKTRMKSCGKKTRTSTYGWNLVTEMSFPSAVPEYINMIKFIFPSSLLCMVNSEIQKSLMVFCTNELDAFEYRRWKKPYLSLPSELRPLLSEWNGGTSFPVLCDHSTHSGITVVHAVFRSTSAWLLPLLWTT